MIWPEVLAPHRAVIVSAGGPALDQRCVALYVCVPRLCVCVCVCMCVCVFVCVCVFGVMCFLFMDAVPVKCYADLHPGRVWCSCI
jgi:hypothetical protein